MVPAFLSGMSQQYACSVPSSTDLAIFQGMAQAEPARSDTDDSPRMRLVSAGKRPIVEVTTSVPQIRLYEAYRALRACGVQVVHTAVRRNENTIVQLLHLAEADGTEFTSRRLRETLSTLRRECGLMLMRPRRRTVQWLEPQAAGGPTWQSYAT